MTDKPPPEDKTLTEDEREAYEEFQRTVRKLVNTPHKPHKPFKDGSGASAKKRGPKPAQ